MNITIVLLFIILFLSFANCFRCGNLLLYKAFDNKRSKKVLMIVCIILFFVAAFRGDFTNDYRLYYYCFEQNSDISFQNLISSRDWLFWVITKFVYEIFGNYLFCYVIVALLMMYFYYKCFLKASDLFFLTLFIFVAVDNYVISFNLSRNILAVSICAVAIIYIWERKTIPYVSYIIVASMIHRSALIMIPMYWILQIDFRKRRNSFLLCACIFATTIGALYTTKIAMYVQSFIGMDYESYGSYGLDFGNIGSALKTTMLVFFILLLMRNLDYSNVKERVLFNGCILAWYLQLLAAKLLMIQRIGYYFSICFALLLPILVLRLNKERRNVYMLCFVFTILVYCAFIQNNTPYYFFWNNKIIFFD